MNTLRISGVAGLLLLAPAALAQQVANEPKALIESIYQLYVKSGPGSTKTPDQYTRSWYSARIRAKINHIDKVCKKAEDMCWPDADFLVDGQDYEIKGLAVKELSRSDSKATVEAKFRNFTSPRTMTFSLIKENDRWVIDEMKARPTGYTLSGYLKPIR